MELTSMIIFRFLPRLSIAGVIVLTCGLAVAQHDVGGGATKDVATGDSTSRTKRTTTRTAVRKPRPPVRRGITAEQYNKQGDEFFEAEQYDDALEAYNKAVQLKPIASAYYHIGWIYNDQDQFAQAIEPLSQAARLRADYAEPHQELGYTYYKLGRSQEAIFAYQDAIRLKPDYGRAYLGLGDVYFNQTKQYAPAMNAYREGVRFKADNATAFYNLAWCYNELNMNADAAGAARQAIVLKADYPEAYNELGYANRMLGGQQPKGSARAQQLFNEAIADYREAVRLRPGYGLAYTGLGDVYYSDLGRCQPAVPPYEQSVRISPNNAKVRYNLGWCYNELQRYAEASEQLREAVRLKPEDAEAHTELGFAYLKLARLPAAVETLRAAIQLKPRYALAHYYLGLVFVEQRNRNGALEQYRILQQLDPEKAKQLYDRAQSLR
jgi:tetratricopeptide (TPR) repeat protein